MQERIVRAIDEIKANRSLFTLGEASIKHSVVLRLLSVLGWDPYNPDEVIPEYSIESKRVDYSLRINGTNKAFIEVKRPSEDLEPHQEQLLEYAFREGVKLAILTNGPTWWFYLPLREGSWEQRRFYAADFREQESATIAERLEQILSKSNVDSGRAEEHAEHLYRGRQKDGALRDTLPRAWQKLITDPDDRLVEILIQETEKLSGFRPEVDQVARFIQSSASPAALPEQVRVNQAPLRGTRRRPSPLASTETDFINKRVQSFTLLGQTQRVDSWKELLLKVAEEMYRRHPNEFDRCLSLRGNKMAYFSLQSSDLSQPAKVAASRIYVETKLNANSIVRRSRDLICLFGHDDRDLVISAA